MVKVGDTVKWSAGKQGMLSGKVTGGEKGKRWRIEKGGQRYYVEKDKVKKGVVKKEKAPAPAKKAEPKKEDGKAVLYDRNIGSSFKYKTIPEMLKGLNTKYKEYDFSRLQIYKPMGDALRAGREARIEVRQITKEGKQKGKLQVSVSYEKENKRFQRMSGIYATKK